MNRVFFIFISFVLLCSCNSNEVFHQYKAMPGYWDKDDVVSFALPQPDSVKMYNLYVHIRNNNDYKYSNLFLITEINFPNGKVITDTLEYEMARPDGTWLGTGFGAIKENKLWLKENIRFFEEGSYMMNIRHAMRNNGNVEGVTKLEGIVDVGFSIEESEE